MGRTAEAAGESYWVGQLAAGANRAAVAYGFASNPEREGEHVPEDYQKYLGRSPSPSEVAFWVNAFTQGVTNENIVTDFVSSDEYFQRPSQ